VAAMLWKWKPGGGGWLHNCLAMGWQVMRFIQDEYRQRGGRWPIAPAYVMCVGQFFDDLVVMLKCRCCLVSYLFFFGSVVVHYTNP